MDSPPKKRNMKRHVPIAKRGSRDVAALHASPHTTFLGLPFLHSSPQLFTTPGLFGALVVCVLCAKDLNDKRKSSVERSASIHNSGKKDEHLDASTSPLDNFPRKGSGHSSSLDPLLEPADKASEVPATTQTIDSYCELRLMVMKC